MKISQIFLIIAFLVLSPAAFSQNKRLLPFQGILADSSGKIVPDGTKAVRFQMFNQPAGGNHIWEGEVHLLAINKGLVNTTLGVKTAFPSERTTGANKLISFFEEPIFLQITVDANGDKEFTNEDAPLFPRQAILPVVFASESANAKKLNGFDWSDILVGGSKDPSTAKIQGARIEPQSITSEQIRSNTITATNIADSQITMHKLAPRQTLTNVVEVGGIAVTEVIGATTSSFNFVEPEGLSVTIETLGRPVVVMLVSGPDNSGKLRTGIAGYANAVISMTVDIIDGSRTIGAYDLQQQGSYTQAPNYLVVPASSVHFIDFGAGKGSHIYKVRIKNNASSNVFVGEAHLDNVRLVAYEL